MEERTIFENYELKGWELGPRMFKIIAASVAINALLFVTAAQGNILTRKGCESPLVSKFCSVLDAVYLGSIVISTDAGYVDEAYEKTDLAEAEITWVDASADMPLEYSWKNFTDPSVWKSVEETGVIPPPGLASVPVAPSAVEVNPATAPQTLPTPNPNPVSNLPNSPSEEFVATTPPARPVGRRNRDPRGGGRTNGSADGSVDPAEVQTDPAQAQEDEMVVDPVTGVSINKRVLRDYANLVKSRVDNREVDLNRPFKVVAEASLTKEGRLDVSIDRKTKLPKSRIVLTEGDEQMVDIAKKAIEAVGDSGWLIYLRTQGIEKIQYTVEQNADQIMVVITSDQPTAERANTIMSGLKGTIEAALLLDQNNIKKLGDDERKLLQSATPLSNGKQFVLSLTLERPTAMEMITRRLQNMQPSQPNSTSETIKDARSKAE